MSQSKTKRNKASLIQALASKNKERIKEALGIQKPMKTLLFKYKEGKIFFEMMSFADSSSNEVRKEEEEIFGVQKEEIIKAYENDFDLWVINVIYSSQSKN